MAYPSKPDRHKAKAFGFSIDTETADRISALAGGVTGRRSMFIRDTLVIGLEQRFGPNWRAIADERIQRMTNDRSAA